MKLLTPKYTLAPEGEDRDQQVAEWKEKYGSLNIKRISVQKAQFIEGAQGEAVAYIKKPGIATMTVVAKVAADEPMKAVKIMLNDCVLACDKEFCEDEQMYLELCQQFGEARKVVGTEIKNG